MIHFARSIANTVHFLTPRRIPGHWLCSAVLITVVAFIAHADAADSTAANCLLVEKEGNVEFARKGSTAWKPALMNQKLEVGDRLRTGLRSRAALRWSELSVLRLSELTSMEVQPPATSTNKPQ